MANGRSRLRSSDTLLAVVLPLALVVVILAADWQEGPKTAFVGVLTAVPMLAAVFGSPGQTAVVGVVTWSAALWFGLVASDGNAAAQQVRLVLIAIAGAAAVAASAARQRREHALADARRDVVVIADAAEHDPLTGVLNRRGVLAQLTGAQTEAWTIALVDVDAFKDINDRFGHGVGDEYLTALAHRITANVASRDVVGRWGGDEFLLAMRLAPADAIVPLERVLERVAAEPVATSAGLLPATVTIGVGELSPGEALDDALPRADRAMYRGKALGRDQLVLHSAALDLTDDPPAP